MASTGTQYFVLGFLSLQRVCQTLLVCIVLGACSEQSETELEQQGEEAAQTVKLEVSNKPVATSKLTTHMLLGTGSVTGVYFPIGGVICRLLNRHKEMHRIRCSLESTGGSIYNLRELRKGNFDLVVSQSDWQYHAYNGSSTFKKDGANEDLRAVFALEADPLTLIVKQESDVNVFDDLQDHVVSFGYARSLQHRIINHLLEVKEWDEDKFKNVRRMSDSKQVGALCNGSVDAILLLMSSLHDMLMNASDDCQMRAVPIAGPAVDKVIEKYPYYRKGQILNEGYFTGSEDIHSFGLGATFVASASTSPKAIYHVVKEIVENFRDFRSLHPSLRKLEKRELPYAGITAPLHPGAVRYYKEARLLKK